MKKRKIGYIALLSLISITLGACDKYLDIRPETSIPDEEAYNSSTGFKTHLNGVYLKFSTQALYGGKANMVLPEVLAHRYYQNQLEPWVYKNLTIYSWASGDVKSHFSSLWFGTYQLIANLNTLLEEAKGKESLFSGNDYNIMKGEAIAMRSFLHFDLLRLYGPVYNSADSVLPAIPYYSFRSATAMPYLKANALVDSLVRDLNVAADLLKEDPVKTNGKAGNRDNSWLTKRNYRFNYFAVKALQARVYSWRRDTVNAMAAAQEVIDVQPAFFAFDGNSATVPVNDPALTGDVLLAAENQRLIQSYDAYFNYTTNQYSLLMPQFAHLNAAYEGNTSDVRFMPAVWNVTPDGTLPGFRTFYKYSKRTLVPIIRSSEMYLLAAELSKDLTTAFGHLNKVRIARGLVALPVGTAATLATEIRKEYVREFFGEGQLFYYYKRLYIKTITDGSAANTTTNITMTPAKYVVPIPDDELSVHRP